MKLLKTLNKIVLSTLVVWIVVLTKPAFSNDFIRTIRTIHIPDFPGAYNASLIEYGNGFLMAFRYDKYVTPLHWNLYQYFQYVGFVWLDNNFNAIQKPVLCQELGNRAYDPRIARIGNQVYLTFTIPNNGDTHSSISSRLCLGRVEVQNENVAVRSLVPLQVSFQQYWEKNWVAFDHKGKMLMVYSINPHVIIIPSVESGKCIHLATTYPIISWNYGTLRCSTPPVLVDGEYLAIFHSSRTNLQTGKYTYYMGAYTFQANPPFAITRISPSPFSHHDFYSTPETPLSNAHVLFPGGLVVKDDTIFVSYGENDGSIKVMEIDKEGLYKSLVPVSR